MLSQYVSNSLSLNRICCFKITVAFSMAKNNKSKVIITKLGYATKCFTILAYHIKDCTYAEENLSLHLYS